MLADNGSAYVTLRIIYVSVCLRVTLVYHDSTLILV